MLRFFGKLLVCLILISVVGGMVMFRFLLPSPNAAAFRVNEIHISDSGITMLRAKQPEILASKLTSKPDGDDQQEIGADNVDPQISEDIDDKNGKTDEQKRNSLTRESESNSGDQQNSAASRSRFASITQSEIEPEWVHAAETELASTKLKIVETDLARMGNVEDEIGREAQSEANRQIRQRFGAEVAERIQFSRAYVEKSFVKRAHIDVLTQDEAKKLGISKELFLDAEDPFVFGYAEVDLGQQFEDDVERFWSETVRQSRMYQLAFWGAGLLGLLGIAFAFFNADRATRGLYTLRLQFASFVGVALFVVVLLWISQVFSWL